MSLSLGLGPLYPPTPLAADAQSTLAVYPAAGGHCVASGAIGDSPEAPRVRGKWRRWRGRGANAGSQLLTEATLPGLDAQRERQGHRIICSATVLDHETLQWVSSISCLVLMLAKGTAIQKSFLAPLFTLQAPASILSWIRGDYGISAAFIALLVRLFYYIPAELDLPFLTALLVIVTPYQAAGLRGTQIGAVISLVIAGYLAFQHFSRAGTFQKAFDQGSIVATLAIVFITAVPFTGLF